MYFYMLLSVLDLLIAFVGFASGSSAVSVVGTGAWK
jgi:hypothetical protein